jgi:hypothetical protein
MSKTRVVLDESEIPTHWYNIVADLKTPPLPPLGGDGNPVAPEQMLAIFPGPVLEQEMSAERWIAIPEEVRKISRCGAPARCAAPNAWSRCWVPRPRFSTSTKASRPPVRTSRTRPCRRPT